MRMGSVRRRRRLHHGPLDDDAGGGVPPEGDQELARQGDEDRLAQPPAKAPDPLVEPQAERRGRLVLQPQPGQLDDCCPQPSIDVRYEPLTCYLRTLVVAIGLTRRQRNLDGIQVVVRHSRQ